MKRVISSLNSWEGACPERHYGTPQFQSIGQARNVVLSGAAKILIEKPEDLVQWHIGRQLSTGMCTLSRLPQFRPQTSGLSDRLIEWQLFKCPQWVLISKMTQTADCRKMLAGSLKSLENLRITLGSRSGVCFSLPGEEGFRQGGRGLFCGATGRSRDDV